MNRKKEIHIPEGTYHELAGFFKVLGDFTRLRIINLLSGRELNVNDIASGLAMEQSAISHQLRILKQSRLVKSRRDGKQVFYSLDDDHVGQVFSQGLEHVTE